MNEDKQKKFNVVRLIVSIVFSVFALTYAILQFVDVLNSTAIIVLGVILIVLSVTFFILNLYYSRLLKGNNEKKDN